ncbi:MAG: TlpA disulfide reductase family protein [Ardenticatenia bacterium]|nr:TlpA disulfide reductase family protein [Ardenticatenia bacterium]
MLFGTGVMLAGCAAWISSPLTLIGRTEPPTQVQENEPKHPLVGTPVPSATVVRLEDGEEVALSGVGAGQVRLVNFWATWCPPCKEEMPELEALYQSGLLVIGLDLDEPPELVSDFVAEIGITYPVYIFPQDDAVPIYRLLGIPTTWLVGADDTIQEVWVGKITRQDVQDALKSLEED